MRECSRWMRYDEDEHLRHELNRQLERDCGIEAARQIDGRLRTRGMLLGLILSGVSDL
jgi:hypothetical protein